MFYLSSHEAQSHFGDSLRPRDATGPGGYTYAYVYLCIDSYLYNIYIWSFMIDALQFPCQKLGWGMVIPFFKGNIDNNGWISNKYCKNEVAHILYLVFFNQG